MSLLEILLIAVSLALDAVVVSVGAGAIKGITRSNALRIALCFGAFQAFMPLLGFFLGLSFREYVSAYGNIVGFVLLLLVGLKMLWETFEQDKDEEKNILQTRILLLMAVATSIDALVVGITFNFVVVNVPLAVAIIGIVTFALSYLGVLAGKKSRNLLGAKIEAIGAIVLIGLAFKILFF